MARDYNVAVKTHAQTTADVSMATFIRPRRDRLLLSNISTASIGRESINQR